MADFDEHILVDQSDDNDSSYDPDESASITTSLTSSVVDYYYQNGRRYHAYKKGEYWGPNDEQQADQLDIGHHLFTLTLNGALFLAPIGPNPHRVLDVGTGTGIWAVDFADQFPSASVIGTDLSPIQPSMIPPNLQFEIDDCCAEWLYTKESFDFVHVRGLYGCVADWPAFYAQAMAHLKPGAWIEQVELSVVPKSDDGTIMPGSVFEQWGQVSVAAGEAFGKSLRTVDESKDGLIKAGFVDVVERRYKWPLGGWSKNERLKELGLWNRLQWEQGIEGWSMYLLTNFLGWKKEEVDVYLARMRLMLRQKGVHAYHEVTFVYGRKPPARSSSAD